MTATPFPEGRTRVMTATSDAWATSTTSASDARPTVSTRRPDEPSVPRAGLLHVQDACPAGEHLGGGVGPGAEGGEQVDLLARAHVTGEGPLAIHGEGELRPGGLVVPVDAEPSRSTRTAPSWTSSPAPTGPRVTAPISDETSENDRSAISEDTSTERTSTSSAPSRCPGSRSRRATTTAVEGRSLAPA